MVARKKVKRTVKKVTKALKKASNAHAKQARSLAALKLKKGGSVKNAKPMTLAQVRAAAKKKGYKLVKA